MFLSRGDRDLGVPTYFQQGTQALSHVEAWNSTFFLSCKRVVRLPVELRLGTWALSRVATGESDLPLYCKGILVVPFNRCRGNGVYCELSGNLMSFQLAAGIPGFLSSFNM